MAIHIYQLFKYNFGSDPKMLSVRIQFLKSERWAEMVTLIVCSLREFGQNCTFLHPTLACTKVKESAIIGFVIFAKKSKIKDVDEQNRNPRKLLLLAQTGPKLPERNKKNEIINIKDFVDEEYF